MKLLLIFRRLRKLIHIHVFLFRVKLLVILERLRKLIHVHVLLLLWVKLLFVFLESWSTSTSFNSEWNSYSYFEDRINWSTSTFSASKWNFYSYFEEVDPYLLIRVKLLLVYRRLRNLIHVYVLLLKVKVVLVFGESWSTLLTTSGTPTIVSEIEEVDPHSRSPPHPSETYTCISRSWSTFTSFSRLKLLFVFWRSIKSIRVHILIGGWGRWSSCISRPRPR